MARKKSLDTLNKTAGQIRGILKRKKIHRLTDPEGEPVKIDYVQDHLLIKDNFVREIGEMWIDIFRRIQHLKELLMEGGPQMYEYLSSKDDIRADSKGGFTEYDFGKNLKIIVGYDLRYDVDDSLMKRSAAHMDEFLKRQGQSELQKIVKRAFKQRNDRYDIKALNRLNQLKIDDEDFKRAMELKNEAITSTPTKLRTEFFVRDKYGEFKSLPLNISYVETGGVPGLPEDLLESRLHPGKNGSAS